LSIDNFSERQITLDAKKNQKIVTVAWSWKKWVKTINISTPATIVASSCWAQIVKPCSRSTSSLTGSSDFFTHLGWKFNWLEKTMETFYETWVGFFSIEWMIPKFDSIYWWNALTPTSLSYALPAIINPIKTDTILYWLSLENIKISIHALHEFGYEKVIVANTTDDKERYIDELWLFSINNFVYWQYWNGKDELFIWDPAIKLWLDYRYNIDQILQKWTIHDNIMASVDVLKWKWELPHKEIIALNAAGIMLLSNVVWTLKEWFYLALNEINTWRPFEKLNEVIKSSNK
jgi:anthranilate phosphoribosyltransferase